jgi:prevent-host-death family protein
MKVASVADVKAKLSAYIKATDKGPVVVTRNGKAVAAIIPLDDEQDLERLMLAYSPKLRAILSAARRRIRNGEGISHDQFWRDAQSSARAKPRRKSA